MGDDTLPGWLDADAAARHLSLRLTAFLQRVKANKLPAPSYHLGERSPRWSRAALDGALEGSAASGPAPLARAIAAALERGRNKRAEKIRKSREKDARGRDGARVQLPAAQSTNQRL